MSDMVCVIAKDGTVLDKRGLVKRFGESVDGNVMSRFTRKYDENCLSRDVMCTGDPGA